MNEEVNEFLNKYGHERFLDLMDKDEEAINNFIIKYGYSTLVDAVKLALYKTGSAPNMTEESTLSEIERKTVDWLNINFENKLKDFFLADLSWANNQQERDQAFADYFTKRVGKRIFHLLPDDIKNHVLAKSL